MKYLKAALQTSSIICFYIKSFISYSINHSHVKGLESDGVAGFSPHGPALGRSGKGRCVDRLVKAQEGKGGKI